MWENPVALAEIVPCAVDLVVTLTSTTTTSTLSTLESIRDSVNRELALANPSDVLDVAHRLLANTRDLVRRQRLFVEALEEVLRWLPRPDNLQVLNARTIAHNLGDRVLEEAGYGEGRSLALHPAEVDTPAVLLQPNLPSTLEAVDAALPHLSRSTVTGLRRRMWRQHVANLYEQQGERPPPTPSDDGLSLVTETFTDLFLVQGAGGAAAEVPPNCPPFPVLPDPGRPSHRRRLHRPRAPPRLAERCHFRPTEGSRPSTTESEAVRELSGPSGPSEPSGVSEPGTARNSAASGGRNSRFRDRSRSRDA